MSHVDDRDRYQLLDEAAIPAGGVPPSHKKIDAHGALYPTDSGHVCLALGRENPAQYVEAFVPVREISVVKESGWGGPFSPPTYSIFAPTEVKVRLYKENDYLDGLPRRDDIGRTRWYYGGNSVGYWHRWSEWREESGSFVSCREMEQPRLREQYGFGHVTWMGIGGWSVLFEPDGGGWIVEVGGDSWASDEWEPGDGFPPAVTHSYDRARKDLCEIMLGRELSYEEFESLGDSQ